MDGSRERECRIVSIAVLLSVVCLALVTWAQLADAGGALAWGPVASVASMVFLGLASLTYCPRRAALMRLLTGTWIIAAPHLFGFSQVRPVFWAYLAIGGLAGATSLHIPRLAAVRPCSAYSLNGCRRTPSGCALSSASRRAMPVLTQCRLADARLSGDVSDSLGGQISELRGRVATFVSGLRIPHCAEW